VDVKTNDPRHDFPFAFLAKILSVYAIIEATVFGFGSLAFGVSLKKLWIPYLLFLTPALFGLPLIVNARRFRDRPKSSAFRSAVGMAAFCALAVIASDYSGLWNWLVPGTTSSRSLIFIIVFGASAASVSAYFSAYGMLTSRKSELQIRRCVKHSQLLP
jgi:uncharacterized membrane protein YhaH (DUF805 family)